MEEANNSDFSGIFEHIEDIADYEVAEESDNDIEQGSDSSDDVEEAQIPVQIPVSHRAAPPVRETRALGSIDEEDEVLPTAPTPEFQESIDEFGVGLHTARKTRFQESIDEEDERKPRFVATVSEYDDDFEDEDKDFEENVFHPRPQIYGYLRNQSTSGQNNKSSPNIWPKSNSSESSPAVKMVPSNIPKPGPAKLRPNSTPEEWLKEAKLCHYLPEDIMKQLCEMVKEHLMEESNIQPVRTPVVVCGDIHGQFYDLLELFRVAGGMPGETNVESPSTMITSDDLEPPDISGMSIGEKVPDISGLSISDKKDDDSIDEEESRGRPRTAGQGSRAASSGADSGVKVNEVSGNGCQNFIFLGDFVDRGYFSLETLTLLLCLKALYPDKITLVRGNHESRQITQVYGFYEECMQKYGNAGVWKACCQVFDFLILSAIIDGQILCVHGGLSPEIRTLDQIRVVARAQEIPHEGAFCDLVWSDPDDIDTWGVSPRGAGWLFGEKVASEFNHVNGLKLIARAHQLVNEGYKYHFPSKNVVTVWSAPNYCYRCGNVASIMNVDSACNEKFSIFAAVPEDKRHVPAGRRPAGEYFL